MFIFPIKLYNVKSLKANHYLTNKNDPTFPTRQSSDYIFNKEIAILRRISTKGVYKMFHSNKNWLDSTRDNSDYLLGGILFSCGLIIGGVTAALYMGRETYADGKDVLEHVKSLFEASETNGPIEGSWIELQPLDTERYGQTQKVFYGGVSRLENNQVIQYEFMANAYTGEVLDVYAVN